VANDSQAICGPFGWAIGFSRHPQILLRLQQDGTKEIWVMDPDGKNQRQFTHYIPIHEPGPPDGSKVVFTIYAPCTTWLYLYFPAGYGSGICGL